MSVLTDPATAATSTPVPVLQDRLDTLRAQAHELGFTIVDVDLHDHPGSADLVARFAGPLQFPDWVGSTLDALTDALRDLSWHEAPGYLVVVDGPRDPRLAGVLQDAAEFQAQDGIPFWGVWVVPPPQTGP
ncbi:barnase inhibitor [Conexibacter sp. W3-3-2]|uniref:Barnase inhibitor n=1 Tax=Paraconexibacter algicola TaxID=2133960 RepID=A0A2T4UCR8_9ACTN|nr:MULTISPECIES: barstar family protein [Solirubrobacterales]MTD43271.1 barnase inhibitor [Conexibacter sp. W3-3-2]PTL55013.1 barnase inhibitor [Paraconexibacter algicola]